MRYFMFLSVSLARLTKIFILELLLYLVRCKTLASGGSGKEQEER